ncbi:PLP-dependent aminotransferase family protein [Sandaracinus amylolyticus]|uniref:MocR-like pyridoxine biosynthesis transcription factor PdxR n=1 Tax=Sandaracinus amylolyticus TaxID=927083 RepID=UPI001F2A6D44|nr:PLP-dependent aminotransferase family protein [Sandaracinus amylolyticus]UJR84456.1 Hypothetical protein I5071_65350 [Sandaracinus amylolyticus]
MDFLAKLDGRRDLTGQLYRQLRAAILDGRMRPGDQLPPTRDLAQRLEVSRHTVTTAYQRLIAESFLEARVGAGTFVASAAAVAAEGRRAPSVVAIRPRAVWAKIPLPAPAPPDAPYDFRLGVPDARLFPYATWRRLLGRELRPSRVRSAHYGDAAGDARLREAIARHVGASRSLQAGADDVVVTNGAQQAFDLVGRVLLDPGAIVAIEDPGYPLARRLFESQGARVVPVPIDDEGIVVSAIPHAAKLVYVTPSHQFPLGMPMSLARRMELLAWARRRRCVIVEDDYDAELRFVGRPVEPLQALDRHGLVVYVGSFSKVLLPALRLGYLVAPRSLHGALVSARRLSDWHAPLVPQRALARFIDEGALARHLRIATREYRARRERLERALAKHLGEQVEPIHGVAGLHVSAWLVDRRADAREIARRAADEGVAVHALSDFAMERRRTGLALGYGAIDVERIDAGIRKLARCIERVTG